MEITSEKGAPCRLYSPWEEGGRIETADGRPVSASASAEGITTFPTQAGETYRLLKP